MKKTDLIYGKTALEYCEIAIEELRHTQEELQAEIQNIRTIQSEFASLKSELQATKQELAATQAELKATKEELENTKVELHKTKQEIEDSLIKTQNQTDSAIAKIKSVKAGIEDGSIIAQKALMLRGKDDRNWIRFRELDSVNHHCLQVWRIDDTWHDDIRVKAASLLQARDDKHWMRFKYVKDGNDTYQVWHVGKWYHSVRVGVARKTG
ncbi:hypothetical protein [Calothrix sp. NIES-2098]|uniref:hypothetical protein n=1 Tax=Calothrix sp. NIES-2098 TaxID=1954171 RepID=UPI000B6042C8|nr:putative cheB/cheR fusion [Calothrix sp. NIES-2098]